MTPCPWTDDLNPAQAALVLCDGERRVAIAGAGSGKTRCFARRVARLLAAGHSSKRLLAVTFTRKAAREMGERIAADCARMGVELPGGLPVISTLHSWGLKLIRLHPEGVGRAAHLTIYDEVDREDVIRAIAAEIGAKTLRVSDTATCRLSTLLSRPEVTDAYAAALRDGNALDFDGIEEAVRVLLTSWGPAQAEWQSSYDEVLVDEYQDTNLAQVSILTHLFPRAYTVVGDHRQSIYGFRGAEVGTIVGHAADAGFVVHHLAVNYRSVPAIVAAANRLMPRDVPMDAHRTGSTCSGAAVSVRKVPFEPAAAAAAVAELIADGIPAADIMLLGRSWREVLPAYEALLAEGIPAVYGGKASDPWATEEARVVLRVAQVAHNRNDDNMTALLARWGRFGAGEVDVSGARAGARAARVGLWQHLAGSDVRFHGIAAAWRELDARPGQPTRAYVAAFLDEWGWWRAVETRGLRGRITRMRDLLATEEASLEPPDLVDWFLSRSTSEHVEATPAGVRCMTVHASKGLEARGVVLLHLVEGRFPSTGSKVTPEEVAEDRRVLYVAVTRAMDRVIALVPETIDGFRGREPATPSPWAVVLTNGRLPEPWSPPWGGLARPIGLPRAAL